MSLSAHGVSADCKIIQGVEGQKYAEDSDWSKYSRLYLKKQDKEIQTIHCALMPS